MEIQKFNICLFFVSSDINNKIAFVYIEFQQKNNFKHDENHHKKHDGISNLMLKLKDHFDELDDKNPSDERDSAPDGLSNLLLKLQQHFDDIEDKSGK